MPASRRGCARRPSATGIAPRPTAAAAEPRGRSASAANYGRTRSPAARPGGPGDPDLRARVRRVTLLREVQVPPLAVAALEPVIGAERYARLLTAATGFRGRLGERTIWNVSSAAVGGGVAEMLQVLVGYAAGLGFPVRWLVIGGEPAFFGVTKRLHNQIHGEVGAEGLVDGSDALLYEQVLAANADELIELVRPG